MCAIELWLATRSLVVLQPARTFQLGALAPRLLAFTCFGVGSGRKDVGG